MRKVVISGVQQATVVEVPDPTPVANWAVVKVLAAPMCTEYLQWRAGTGSHLGHEAAGEVVAVAQPGAVKPGDRVVVMPQYPCGRCDLCRSGDYIHCQQNVDFGAFTGQSEGRATYAQYLLKPDWLLLPVPDEVAIDEAALACCGLGPTWGAWRRMQVAGGQQVLVTGAGPVGLGGVLTGTWLGAEVIVVDAVAWRRERALQLGAAAAIDPTGGDPLAVLRDLTAGRGVDAAVDCSGVPAAQRFCLEAVRRRGQVTFVGECSDELTLRASPDLIRRGLTIHGSWHYNLGMFGEIMRLIAAGGAVSELISHRYPMDQVQAAFEQQMTRETAKVVLEPWS